MEFLFIGSLKRSRKKGQIFKVLSATATYILIRKLFIIARSLSIYAFHPSTHQGPVTSVTALITHLTSISTCPACLKLFLNDSFLYFLAKGKNYMKKRKVEKTLKCAVKAGERSAHNCAHNCGLKYSETCLATKRDSIKVHIWLLKR